MYDGLKGTACLALLDHRESDMPALSRAMAAAGGAKGTLDRGVASSDKKSASKARNIELTLKFDD